jgi:hypothetical protein
MEQVGLAEPHITVDKKWVVNPAGILGNSHASGMSKAVAWAGDKIVKGKIVIKS